MSEQVRVRCANCGMVYDRDILYGRQEADYLFFSSPHSPEPQPWPVLYCPGCGSNAADPINVKASK